MTNKAIRWVRKQLKKLFYRLFGRNNSGQYVQPVLHAAQGRAYVETVSNLADSLHLQIKRLYEEDLQHGFLALMSSLAPHFRKGNVRLAIDRTEIGYYGKEQGFYIVGTSYNNKSYTKAFEYLTISVLTGSKEERIPLYALPWHIGQDVVRSIEALLDTVKPWLGKIEVVQFDRGFHNNELIAWLESHKIPYLIHIQRHGKTIKDLVENTKSFNRTKYETTYNASKTTHPVKFNLYVCKNIQGKDWLFASSIWFKTKWQIRNLYQNRWQIETNYAVTNQNRIMSKSTNVSIRYFYFLCDIILQVLWRIGGCCNLPFKTFLRTFVAGTKQIFEMKPTLKPCLPP